MSRSGCCATDADVALLHPALRLTVGLDVQELTTESQAVVLPAGHRLTGRQDVRLADVTELAGLPPPRWPNDDGSYPEGPGPQVRDQTQLLSGQHPDRLAAAQPVRRRAGLVRAASRL